MKNQKNIIFIVDDDPDDRQIILDAFLENDFNIDYVFIENGDQLIETLNTSTPDQYPSLILLDLNMPGMMGLQVLKVLKNNKNWKPIPVVVLTTSTLDRDREASYEMGASCFLRKPVAFDDLTTMTTSIVNLWFNEKKIHHHSPGV
ncbi:MAG: response regulator [Chitinophagaceae bacterium]|nr:MAG: response regulator [Chitinophagaceae bacterium]